MSTVTERKLMDSTVDKIIPLACNGNKLAEKYLHDMAWVNRIIDDLYDKDYEVSRENIERAFFVLSIEIPTNPFYLSNFQSLMAQHVVIYNSWMDSNAWENDEAETKRIYAHVLKDYIGELLPLVAFLTGGTGLMRKISLQVRESYIKEL
jgi:hypothetical protein